MRVPFFDVRMIKPTEDAQTTTLAQRQHVVAQNEPFSHGIM